MDTRKLEILKTDTYAMLSLTEPGQGGSVITRLELENIEAMREVRRRYNAYPDLVAALEEAQEALQGMRDYVDGDKGELSDPLGAMDEAMETVAAAIANATNTH